MVNVEDWSGLVDGRRRDTFDGLRIDVIVASSSHSWAGPFRVRADDGEHYFVKARETCPDGHGHSLAVEQIVAAAGRLIHAPVCDTSLIRIPPLMADWEVRPGAKLQSGLAHASRVVAPVSESRGRPDHRGHDDNEKRHVGAYALYDWCFGSDPQWLYDLDNDKSIYSHDHGLYLPPVDGRQGWFSIPDLLANVNVPRQLYKSRHGLHPSAVSQVAESLERVQRDDLVNIMISVPSSWPVTDRELEMLGWFLESRAPQVANRVRALL